MSDPARDQNIGGSLTGGTPPEDSPRQGDVSRQEKALHREEVFRWKEGRGREPDGGLVPGTIEATFLQALSGDVLKAHISFSEAPGLSRRSGATTGRSLVAVYLWGIQAPRPSQPFGTAATGAVARLCRGRGLTVAARRAGPEGRIAGSVAAEGNNGAGGEEAEVQDVGRALVRRGLAWQDQRGPSSAQLRALEQEARRREAGLWQQEAPTPPWAWGS